MGDNYTSIHKESGRHRKRAGRRLSGPSVCPRGGSTCRHCSVYFKKFRSSTEQHGPTLQRFPPIPWSIHPSVHSGYPLFCASPMYLAYNPYLLFSSHSPPASQHHLSDGPAAGMLTSHHCSATSWAIRAPDQKALVQSLPKNMKRPSLSTTLTLKHCLILI